MPVSDTPAWKPLYAHLMWRRGDKGNGTREVQTALKRLGADIAIDGDFGAETAVIEFQAKNGLAADSYSLTEVARKCSSISL